MRKRAESVDATRSRILEAAAALFSERFPPEVTLREIASRAGVALQTVVNHFGSKDGLVTAVLEGAGREGAFADHRVNAPADDIPRAVALLIGDYERTGDAAIRALALEEQVAGMAAVLAQGRAFHRAWVGRTFPAALAGLGEVAREQKLAQLIAVTDVYVWKLLRRDLGLSEPETVAAVGGLVEAIHR
ncbi:MAG: TetR/AcrR family transcriptional regulator [Solirubrobacteraceae bacterium]